MNSHVPSDNKLQTKQLEAPPIATPQRSERKIAPKLLAKRGLILLLAGLAFFLFGLFLYSQPRRSAPLGYEWSSNLNNEYGGKLFGVFGGLIMLLGALCLFAALLQTAYRVLISASGDSAPKVKKVILVSVLIVLAGAIFYWFIHLLMTEGIADALAFLLILVPCTLLLLLWIVDRVFKLITDTDKDARNSR